jgi:O-antigen/teichoic acid export membrane protein
MKRISKNVVSIVGSDIARRLMGFFTIAYLARKVGVADFGAINIGFTILSYALLVSSAGLSSFGVRAIARGESSTLVNIVTTIKLISSSGAFILIALLAVVFIADDQMTALVILFCLSLFPGAFLIDWYYQGKERMGVIGAVRIISAMLYLLLVLIFVHSPADILWVAVASVCGDIIATLVLWIYYRRREGGSKLYLSLQGWRSLIRQSLPIGGGSMLAAFSVNLPLIVLGVFLSNSDAGIFSAASKLVFFLLMIDRVLGTILLPASSRMHTQAPGVLPSSLGYALKWIMIIAVPVCAGGTILADRIIPLVFGAQYLPSVGVFRILIWFFLSTTLHTVYTSGLIAVGQEKLYALIMMMSAGLYLFSVVILTLIFGTQGTAMAMVLSEAATVVYMQYRLRRFIAVPFPASTWKVILSAIVMVIVLLFFSSLNVFAAVVFGAIIYFVVLFTSRGITADDWQILGRKLW